MFGCGCVWEVGVFARGLGKGAEWERLGVRWV
jgi:hypothetical protein